MKKTVAGAFLIGTALLCAAPSAQAALPYVRGSVGIASISDDNVAPVQSYDTGYTIAGAVGLSASRYRVEAEVGHQANGIKTLSKDLSMTTYMANCYLDFALPMMPIKPYVTAGAGMANVDIENAGSDNVMAWQVGAGIGFSAFPLTTFDLQYRYIGTSDPEISGTTYKAGTNNVTLGLRFNI